ncbi:hypothetical protein SLS60_000405 [Paraconiothyrium brasiliense]|uniref:Uncharacterized protein n=1 Tax=Paraconiothyrium brasiliense TaxID=300254 RepID=A0ABR3S656_9PLEO
MARLNPHPVPSPRAHSGTASPRLKYTVSCPLLRTQTSRTSSKDDARASAEQEHEQAIAFQPSLSDENEEPRPRLIIARARRKRLNPNLTIRKKTSQYDLSRPDLNRIYPFLSNVVYLEVPDESDEEHGAEGNDADSEGPDKEEQYGEAPGSSDEEHGENVGRRSYSNQEEEGDEEQEDGDSAYGSVEIPDAACPTIFTHPDSMWTYAAICKWRDAVEMVPLSPPKVVPKIDVRKRATPKTPRKSPSKRLLTF